VTHRNQRGQSLVLAAILMTILVGFTGLAIDGGEATAQQQLVRNAADGASLAAAYGIAVQGDTLAAATTQASYILSADGLPTSDLTLSFLDSGGAVTATPASVATVRAVVAHNSGTYFLGVVGFPSIRITGSADASTTMTGGGAGGGTSSPICAICLMKGSGTDFSTGASAVLTLSGPLQVNSNGVPALDIGNNTVVTATQALIPSGGTVRYGSGASLTPAPTVSPAISDPFPTLAAPSIGGAAAAYTAPGGTSSISAGLYSTITVPGGATLTLNAGIYVVTGALNLTGGTVRGSGVMIYLACAAYPTACPGGGSGAVVSISSGSSINLAPPTSGTYVGISLFADRNNGATSTVSGSSLTMTGTWYSIAMPVRDTHTGDSMSFGQLIISTLTLANNDTVTFAGPTPATGGVVGLSA
jgi:Flp pilus assembly protein TadG